MYIHVGCGVYIYHTTGLGCLSFGRCFHKGFIRYTGLVLYGKGHVQEGTEVEFLGLVASWTRNRSSRCSHFCTRVKISVLDARTEAGAALGGRNGGISAEKINSDGSGQGNIG